MTVQLLNVKEAAEMLRRSEAQMRYMRHKGTGPRSALIAGRVMYRYQDIEEWVNQAFEGETE